MSICIGVHSFSYNSINSHYSIVHYTFLYTASSTRSTQMIMKSLLPLPKRGQSSLETPPEASNLLSHLSSPTCQTQSCPPSNTSLQSPKRPHPWDQKPWSDGKARWGRRGRLLAMLHLPWGSV